MNRQELTPRLVCLVVAALLALSSIAEAAEKMSPAKAGTIGQPTGKIAFVRNKNVWAMDVSGANQTLVSEVGNADGRLSWAPDGRRFMFTRAGKVDLQGPDYMGGIHRVYDLFIAYLDSSDVGNINFWRRLTFDLGGRSPEWTADGKSIVFQKDMEANVVNADYPNYQICIMDETGENVEILRKDWRQMEEFFIAPSMNADGEIVFVHFYENAQQGLAKLSRDKFTVPLSKVKAQSDKMRGAVAPSWSPDGKWIAYVGSKMDDPGVFITTPDFSETYLVFQPPPATSLYTVAPSFSPDSKWLTFSTTDGSVWICDIMGNGQKRLTGPGLDKNPAWSKAPPAKKLSADQ